MALSPGLILFLPSLYLLFLQPRLMIRQRNGEMRERASASADYLPDTTSVCFDDPVTDRQTEPDYAFFVRLGSIKFVKNTSLLTGRKSQASVGDFHDNLVLTCPL